MAKKPNAGGSPARRGRPPRAASAGDNSKAAPPPATPALIAEAIRVYGEDREAIASATGKCGAHLAAYEAQGVDTEFVKATWKEMGRTEAEAAKRHAVRTQYLVAAQVISPADADWASGVSQAGLDLTPAAGDVADRLAEVRARDQGRKAGLKGHSLESNPYKHKPGSPQFVGWLDGLQVGLEMRKQRKPDADKTTHASTNRERREPPAKEDGKVVALHPDADKPAADGIEPHPTVQ